MSSRLEVELFSASLDVAAEELAALAATLSPAERSAAAARGDARDRDRFLVDHGRRRRLLAERLGCAPAAVGYVVSGDGKPRLAAGGPRFSASRAGDTALYALCEDAEVGVDVEPIATDTDLESLGRRLLSPAERELLWALPAARRPDAFYACWTRREARGKALGVGLRFPLTDVEVWTGQPGPVRSGGVEVANVALAPGLAAAVAVLAATGDDVGFAGVVTLG